MPCFRDAQDVYDTIGEFLRELVADPGFRAPDMVVRYELSEPEAVITTVMEQGAPGRVACGESALRPEVTVRMKADTAHLFWLGEADVSTAVARREITAEGHFARILELMRLSKTAAPRYRAQLAREGRLDLLGSAA